MVGDGRQVGVERLLEHHAGALAAHHAQEILRGRERGIGRDRRQALLGVEQRRQEHRHGAAHEVMVRRRLVVGQHGDADPERLDGVEAARGGEQLGHLGESLHARRRQAAGDRRGIAAALGVGLPQERRDALEAARGDQFLQGVAAHDQPALFAVDLAHHRVGHDDAVEAAIHPCLQHWNSFPCRRQPRIAEIYCQS